MKPKRNVAELYKVAEVELTYKTKVKASERPQIIGSEDAYNLLKTVWDEGKISFVEEIKVLLLNRAIRVLSLVNVSTSGVSDTLADLKIIYVAAIKANACALIICHNHPSGHVKPSRAHEELTQRSKMQALSWKSTCLTT